MDSKVIDVLLQLFTKNICSPIMNKKSFVLFPVFLLKFNVKHKKKIKTPEEFCTYYKIFLKIKQNTLIC